MATKKKGTRKKRAAKQAKRTTTTQPTMTDQLKEARKRYTVSKSANGTTSAHNADDVAILLAGNTPDSVCATVEHLSGLNKGELAKKHGHTQTGLMAMINCLPANREMGSRFGIESPLL